MHGNAQTPDCGLGETESNAGDRLLPLSQLVAIVTSQQVISYTSNPHYHLPTSHLKSSKVTYQHSTVIVTNYQSITTQK